MGGDSLRDCWEIKKQWHNLSQLVCQLCIFLKYVLTLSPGIESRRFAENYDKPYIQIMPGCTGSA